jgi:hypothetical protein
VYVVVDEPRGGKKYGADVAGPAAVGILEEALGYVRGGTKYSAPTLEGFVAMEAADSRASSAPARASDNASRRANDVAAKRSGDLAPKRAADLAGKNTGDLAGKNTGDLAGKNTGDLAAARAGDLASARTSEQPWAEDAHASR